MSNFNEAEHQAAEVVSTSQNAAQSIANANPATDKPDNCAKKSIERPSRLKTISAFDMNEKGAWRARRDLYRSLCHTPKGSVSFEAAELYEDILDLFIGNADRVQNFRKSENSYYWGRPIAKWAKKYKCTERQFDYWLKLLRDCGLIATCMMKTKTNMLQIRPLVAAGSACLSGWPDSQNYSHLLKAQTQVQQGPAAEFCPAAGGQILSQCSSTDFVPPKDLGLPVGVACKGLKDFVDASPATEATPLNLSVQTGEDKQTQTKPASAGAVLEPRKFSTATEKNSAGLLWLSLIAQYMPEHALPLKARDWKIVRDLCNRIDGRTDLPGHEPVLRWVIRHWAAWSTSIGYADQVAPAKLTTVLDTAVAAYAKERQRLAEKAAYKAQIAKANAEIEALQAQKAVAPPPVAKPNKWQQLLADKAEATQQTATPLADLDQGTHMPEPAQPAVAPAVECPPVVQVTKETCAPLLLEEQCDEPEWDRTPLYPQELAKLSLAKDAANKAKGIKQTAAANTWHPKIKTAKNHATA